MLLTRKFALALLVSTCSFAASADEGDGAGPGGFLLAAEQGSERYVLLGPALSYHQQRTHARRSYNEAHAGFGIEQRAQLAASVYWERRLSLSVMNDSFDQPGLFAQAGLLRDLGSFAGARVLAGASAGLAYKYMKWEGPRQWTPLLGATFALKPRSGMGLSGTYVYKRNRTTGQVSGIFTLQTSYSF